ncbi:MAG: hypothetical protein K8I30_14045, partial [Anaerolineae bacterium]|nr:hypothetical protein [Anaerolineae bacterium]
LKSVKSSAATLMLIPLCANKKAPVSSGAFGSLNGRAPRRAEPDDLLGLPGYNTYNNTCHKRAIPKFSFLLTCALSL